MVRTVATIALALVSTDASDVAGAGSVGQVRKTLQALLGNVQSDGRASEAALQKTQQWCDTTSMDLSKKSEAMNEDFAETRLNLEEQEAATEEAAGTVQQLHADISLVSHTITQTESMRDAWLKEKKDEDGIEKKAGRGASLLQRKGKLSNSANRDVLVLGDLVENKKETLASLEGELEVVLLAHAQMQARAAETKRRISDRSNSADAEASFTAGFAENCHGLVARASSHAEACAKEADALDQAVRLLGHMESTSPQTQPVADQETAHEDSGDDGDVSFVQVSQSQITADDVLSLLGGGPMTPSEPEPTRSNQALLQRPAPRQPAFRQKIGQLLTQVQSKGTTEAEQRRWCASERERNELSLRLAQDLVGQVSAEIEAHSDAETQLADAADRLQGLRDVFNSTAMRFAKETQQEAGQLARGEKDRQLAGKILSQAVKIIQSLEDSGSLDAHKGGDPAAMMMAAKQASEAAAAAAATSRHQSEMASKALGEKFIALTAAQDHERTNVELLRDEHVTQRGAFLETQRAYQSEVFEAGEYLKKLKDECASSMVEHSKQQRTVEVHALEDARAVLDGRGTAATSSGVGLRGATSATPASSAAPVDTSKLSPLERAALEMGVAVN